MNQIYILEAGISGLGAGYFLRYMGASEILGKNKSTNILCLRLKNNT